MVIIVGEGMPSTTKNMTSLTIVQRAVTPVLQGNCSKAIRIREGGGEHW